MKPLTKTAERKALGKLARIEETLTFVRTQYTDEQKARATNWTLELEMDAAYLRGLTGAS